MQSGRSYAVVLDRVPGLPEACVTISYAESPPLYAGDTMQSTDLVQYAATLRPYSRYPPSTIRCPER